MRIDALLRSQNSDNAKLSAILDRVNIGDVVRAQVIDIAVDEITLKLFDGSTITASTADKSENLDVKPGDFIDLKVKEKLDGKIFLEPFKNGSGRTVEGSEALLKQLKALGMPQEPGNLEIVQELKNNNMPINKSNFDKALGVISGFKDVNAAKAVFLMANKLDIEEKNISALKQLVDEKAKISQAVYNLMESMESIEDEGLLKNLAGRLSADKAAEYKGSAQPPIQASRPSTDSQSTALDHIKNMLQAAHQDISAASKTQHTFSLEKGMLEKLNAFFSQDQGSLENVGEKFPRFVDQSLLEQGKTSQDLKGRLPQLIKDIAAALETDKNAVLPDKNLPSGEKADLKREIRSILEKLHVNISSESLKEELNVKNLYKDLYNKLETIKEALTASTLPNKAEILSGIENTENNIRFMNQLNNYNTYVQIPLNIWNRNSTGELYVLKRGSKKRRIDPENATMLLSLNTENLGQVDTFIGVSKKNVNISMRVENNTVIDFIRGYHKELYERMQKKNYKLVDLKFRISEDTVNLTNASQEAEKEFGSGGISIDFRL